MSEVVIVGDGLNWTETPESVNARLESELAAAKERLIACRIERDALQAERDRLLADLAERERNYRELSDADEALEAERDKLCEALRAVEWTAELGDEYGNLRPACRPCRRFQTEGHAPDCIVGLALKEGE